jgi:hypothetical protein
MKTFLQLLRVTGGIFGIIAAHLTTSYLLPPPWGHVNTIFVLLSLLLLFGESGIVVWIAFATHFVIELYATSPFGIVLFSGTMSVLIAVWLFRYFFTNRSWHTAFAVSFVGVGAYRLLSSLFLALARALTAGAPLPWRHLLAVYGWEMLLSAAAAGFLYLAIVRLFQKKPMVLPTQWTI